MSPSQTELFDRLFASLPRIEPVRRRMGMLPTSYFPMMQWSLNRPYLGFTPQERRREHQVQIWITRGGLLPRPSPCSVCGETKSTAFHAENYYDIWSMCSICQNCHKRLHLRHRNPRSWSQLVEQHRVSGDEWFALTPMDSDADFAGYLRRRFGDGYGLMEVSVRPLPDWITDQVPDTGLMPLDFVPEGDILKPGATKSSDLPRFQQLDLALYPGPIKPVARRY